MIAIAGLMLTDGGRSICDWLAPTGQWCFFLGTIGPSVDKSIPEYVEALQSYPLKQQKEFHKLSLFVMSTYCLDNDRPLLLLLPPSLLLLPIKRS